MPPRPPLSKAELEVARVLWNLSEATPRQVYEAYPKKDQVDFATVQTYLRRLEAKGYLKARRKGRVKTYLPKVRPGQVVRETVDDFMNLLFDGEALPLLHHLIKNRQVSREDIEQFRQMLSDYEDEQDEPDQ